MTTLVNLHRKLFSHDAGWSSMVARRAHNPKVVGSNPAPATKEIKGLDGNIQALFFSCFRQGRQRRGVCRWPDGPERHVFFAGTVFHTENIMRRFAENMVSRLNGNDAAPRADSRAISRPSQANSKHHTARPDETTSTKTGTLAAQNRTSAARPSDRQSLPFQQGNPPRNATSP